MLKSTLFAADAFDFSGVMTQTWKLLLLVAVFLASFVVLTFFVDWFNKRKGVDRSFSTADLTYGAVCIAVAYALSFIPVFSLPNGGSITIASAAPILIYGYYFGFRKGSIVSLVYMLLQLIQKPYIISPWSALFDYLLPYSALSATGVFAFNRKKYESVISGGRHALKAHGNFVIGVALYFVIRYFSHVLGGVLFWSYGIDFMSWSGDLNGTAAWTYSLVYNALYLVPDTLVAVAASLCLLSSRSFNTFMAPKGNYLKNTEIYVKDE